MSKSQKFFRIVWRINAILILAATATLAIGIGSFLVSDLVRSHRRTDTGVIAPSPPGKPNLHLRLTHAQEIAGTSTIRLDLQSEGGGEKFSSGSYSETRNILFVEPGQKTGRWLLPDNEHILDDPAEVIEKSTDGASHQMAAVVVVKPANGAIQTGRLLLFDPVGKRIVEISSNVQQLHRATLSGGEIVVLFEQNNQLFRSTFDPVSLSKKSEQEVALPKLD